MGSKYPKVMPHMLSLLVTQRLLLGKLYLCVKPHKEYYINILFVLNQNISSYFHWKLVFLSTRLERFVIIGTF